MVTFTWARQHTGIANNRMNAICLVNFDISYVLEIINVTQFVSVFTESHIIRI